MAKKILVIDDDPMIVKYLVSLLNDNGYETCTADDGVRGYEVLKKEKPDLITLDLQMAEEWGTNFYRRISKNKEFKERLTCISPPLLSPWLLSVPSLQAMQM